MSSNPMMMLSAATRPAKRSRSATILATGIAALLLAGATGKSALGQSPTTAIYPGGSPQSAGVSIHNAGSGTITPDTSHVYAGGGSLKLVTHGLYQGGAIDLNTPYDLAPLLTNRNAYVQFAVLPPPPATDSTSSGGKFGMGGPNAPTGPGGPGAPSTGGGMSAGNPFGGSTRSGKDSSATKERFAKAQALENLRVVFVTSAGNSIEKKIPVSYAVEDTGWKVISVPLCAIAGLTADDAKIKEVRVYGDTTGTMYLGKIGVVVDTTRIMIEPVDEQIVTANQKYRYTVSAHGGVSPLNYSWDWDDRDGIQNEAEGKSASHLYRKAGDYKVTVTVSDPYGVKATVSTKFNIHIP